MGLVIFPWQELTEEEKQQLQQGQEEKPWYQQGLSPFLDHFFAFSFLPKYIRRN
ncbi:hypothetical protein [Nostoc sp.]|uniref:hypothetical protein n=1 Tax=Nostoc sp. TaxID=1180 RepID=UPI002FF90184